jgi:hypothetical protein
MTLNARIRHDKFLIASSNGITRVHGSFFVEAYVNVSASANHSLQVAFKAVAEQAELFVAVNKHQVLLSVDSRLEIAPEDGSYSISSTKVDDHNTSAMITITFTSSKRVAGETKLQIDNREWVLTVESLHYPLREQNGEKYHLDMHVRPISTQLGLVAPHGLLGQTFDFDNIAVDGAKDNYDDKEVVTRAMGEGAIEGIAKDYKIPGANPYSSFFKYSRWGLVKASPRDTTKLTGYKHAKVKKAEPRVEL